MATLNLMKSLSSLNNLVYSVRVNIGYGINSHHLSKDFYRKFVNAPKIDMSRFRLKSLTLNAESKVVAGNMVLAIVSAFPLIEHLTLEIPNIATEQKNIDINPLKNLKHLKLIRLPGTWEKMLKPLLGEKCALESFSLLSCFPRLMFNLLPFLSRDTLQKLKCVT